MTASKDQDLARERKKIRELQAAIREVEEGLLGLQPASKKSKVEEQGTIKSTAVPEKNLAAPIASSLSLRNGNEPTTAAPSAETREITNVISSNARTLAY